MAEVASDRGRGVVGREAELAALDAFLEAAPAGGAFLLEGEAGMGKTTLWEAACDAGRRKGLRVLTARPKDLEACLAFAALIDLFDGIETTELADVPAPQLRALEVALLREVATASALETHAIAAGVLNALRAIAARDPIVVAIDDVQWLDVNSARAISYAARRLHGDRVCLLLAKRAGASSPIEESLEQRGLQRLAVRPLTLGATRSLLHLRLGLTLSRPVLRRVQELTLGNPLSVIEVGRKLVEEGVPAIGDPLPVPETVEDLLGTRVAGLPGPTRRLLLAVALSQDLRVGQLAALGELEALDAALDAGVVVVEDEHVRAAHPLLAAAATRNARPAERRDLHRRLAAVVDEPELRVRHLALATTRPDPALAAEVATAAEAAARRGAVHGAVELSDHALRLTPRDDPERVARLLDLAGHLEVAGEIERMAGLLTPVLDELPSGEARVRAYTMLSSSAVDNDDIRRYIERALEESGEEVRLWAPALSDLSLNTILARVEQVEEEERRVTDALRAVDAEGPEVKRLVLYSLAWARGLRGGPVDDLVASDAGGSGHIATSPARVAAQRLAWRGEVRAARTAVGALLATAEERGEGTSYALERLHMCELELRAGSFASVTRLLDEWAEPGERELAQWPVYERCRALLDAGRGLPADARAWAANAIARSDATGVRWDRLETQRALGLVELLERAPAEAARNLRTVWEHTQRAGVEDPGVFPVAPDLVEALAELGELDEAGEVTSRLSELAERQQHPWGRISGRRCAAIVRLATSYDDEAARTLERAAEEYGKLELAFDRARTLLSLGRAQRRFKKWGAARDVLQPAAAAFDELDAPGWSEATRSELARVGARRPAKTGELTATERRVAELAADGLSNKEIASALVVTVSTVEFHLSNTYAKLGVRSRGQLAARLAAGPAPR